MCRNIKTLFNFEPPATEGGDPASALQFVRKLSGFNKPSQGKTRPLSTRRWWKSPMPPAGSLDLAAHPRAAPRPPDRGREGEGAVAAAVWLKHQASSPPT